MMTAHFKRLFLISCLAVALTTISDKAGASVELGDTSAVLEEHSPDGKMEKMSTLSATQGYSVASGIQATRLGRVVRFHTSVPSSTRSLMKWVVDRTNQVSGAGLIFGSDTASDPGRDEIVLRVMPLTSCGSEASGCAVTSSAFIDGLQVPAYSTVEVASAVVGSPYEMGVLLHEFGHTLGLSHYDLTYNEARQIMSSAIDVQMNDWRSGDVNGLKALVAPSLNPNVKGSVDGVAVKSEGLRVNGWAIDFDRPSLILTVDVTLNGLTVAQKSANVFRPDLALAFPQAGGYHGYDIMLPTPTDGIYQICVSATGHRGQKIGIGCRSLLVNRSPVGSVDTARQFGPRSIEIAGWAFDPDTTQNLDIHIYVDGRWASQTRTGLSRADVSNVYPHAGGATGYRAVVPAAGGSRQICAYAINVLKGSSNSLLGCRNVTVRYGNPIGNFESASVSKGVLSVSGWGLDPDAREPIEIHVYISGYWGGVLTASGVRLDVGRAFPGYGDNHGFGGTVRQIKTKGTHSVCAYAINVLSGSINSSLGCRTVTVS